MYYIIIGCGRIGSHIANTLSNDGHHVCIIDRDKSRLEVLGSGFNGFRINGVEFDEDVLESAGIENADVFLALSQDDNINLTCAQIAQNVFHVPRVIARVNDPDKESIYDKFNIENICPTKIFVDLLSSLVGEVKK